MGTIADNIARLQERIYTRAIKAGRKPEEVTLVAISKTVDVARISEAVEAGITTFGENYVQEAKEKIPQLGTGITWHMVGHLQTNKVKYVLPLFSMIQSVDSFHLAQEISKQALKLGKVIEVLIEVNSGDEKTKSGFSAHEVGLLLDQVLTLKSIVVKGFMTMPPFSTDPEMVRPYFKKLRRLRDEVFPSFPHLSMGMSSDFEAAIEEGATMLRIGTALFGERT